MSVAAVRGAITVSENTPDEIRSATAKLLATLLESNGLKVEQIVSVLFTATPDLDADFPAHAARMLGWTEVPLLGASEIAVPGALPRVVRVLLTVAGVPEGRRLVPSYLEGAALLRPDLEGSGAPTAAAAPIGPETRIAIIGLGQIGGSIGLALRGARGWRRMGFDRDPPTLTQAMTAGALDERASSLAEACRGAQLAVLAVPVDELPATIAEAAAALPPSASLMDTGSARAGITEALRSAAAQGIAAVGGHPLAGNEWRGFAAARADLFQSATFVVLPVARTGVPDVVSRLIAALGARSQVEEAVTHDHALARTSHLPYLVSCALRELGRAAAAGGLSGPGYRDMTRLATSDPAMAQAYCRANAIEVSRAWEEMRGLLNRWVVELGEDR